METKVLAEGNLSQMLTEWRSAKNLTNIIVHEIYQSTSCSVGDSKCSTIPEVTKVRTPQMPHCIVKLMRDQIWGCGWTAIFCLVWNEILSLVSTVWILESCLDRNLGSLDGNLGSCSSNCSLGFLLLEWQSGFLLLGGNSWINVSVLVLLACLFAICLDWKCESCCSVENVGSCFDCNAGSWRKHLTK